MERRKARIRQVQGAVLPDFNSLEDACEFIYRSYNKIRSTVVNQPPDEVARACHIKWTRQVLDSLGAPDSAFRSILVVGSKGKGSTAAMVAALIEAAGYRTGLFTSPHLVSPTERIRVNGKTIPEDTFLHLLQVVAPTVEAIEAQLPGDRYVSPITVYLAMACLFFRDRNVDFAILECGRGGIYDPTHAVYHPWVVVTELMDEHREQLGPTLRDIAWHKAGVIVPGVRWVVAGTRHRAILDEITDRAEQVGARVAVWGSEFHASGASMSLRGVRGRILSGGRDLGRISLSMLGYFQMKNAAVATHAVERILGPLERKTVASALGAVHVPGRCEVISRDPLVLVDGSIHRASARYLTSVFALFRARPLVTLLGVPKGKDFEGVVQILAPISDHLITTEIDGTAFRFPAQEVALCAGAYSHRVRHVPSVRHAIMEALALSGRAGMVAVVGTQAVLGKVIQIFGMRCEKLWTDPPPWGSLTERRV